MPRSISVAQSFVESPAQIQLQESVTVRGALALIICSIIGSGIFSSAGPVLQSAGSTGASLLVWLFAGIMAVCLLKWM